MEEVLGILIAFVVRCVDGVLGFFGFFHSAERRNVENSRVGESPVDVRIRRWWNRLYKIWFWTALLLLCLASWLLYR